MEAWVDVERFAVLGSITGRYPAQAGRSPFRSASSGDARLRRARDHGDACCPRARVRPALPPHSPTKQELSLYRKPPNQTHWLGTDSLGRDVCTRMIYAGRVSLSVGLVAVGIYETIAVILGAIAGYYGHKVDWVIMRVVDVVMTIPTMIIIIFVVSILGPSMYNAMTAIGIMGWPEPTRLVRGQILSLR